MPGNDGETGTGPRGYELLMTPLELLGLIALLGVVRLSLVFVPAAVNTPSAAVAGARPGTAVPRPEAGPLAALKEYLDSFIAAGAIALLLITFVVHTYYIPSGSMEPTLQIHDVLAVNEIEYRFSPPHDGDIVVFPPPVQTSDDFIKRLIASPGEKLRIQNGIVYRNDVAVAEPYIAQKPNYDLEIRNYGIYVNGTPIDPTYGNVPPKSAWTRPDTIPPGCYFMMGDNRNDSDDSHLWGFAQLRGTFATGPEAGNRAGFTGHAQLLFWPPNRAGVLR